MGRRICIFALFLCCGWTCFWFYFLNFNLYLYFLNWCSFYFLRLSSKMITDSAFLVVTEDNPGPDAPGTLGTLKDELESSFPGVGARIVRMASTGPKSYSYVVADRDGNSIDRTLKMKGINLQSRVKIDHDDLVGLLRGGKPLQVPQTLFKKNIPSNSVVVNDIVKKVSFTSNKRVLLKDSPTLDTLPYGYKG